MLPWKNLISYDRQAPKSVYLQIAEGIINAIRLGYLQSGQRLPGSRQLAEQLGVNRKTSLLAYEELSAQGWIISRSSRGTFVAETLPVIKPVALPDGDAPPKRSAGFHWHVPEFLQPPVSFSLPLSFDDGLPDIRLAPIEELARAHSRSLRNLWDHRQLSYQDALGYPQLRAQMARELNATRGLNITPDHIMITRGSQMAIFLAARIILTDTNKTIVMTRPGYRTAGLNFQYAGGQVKYIPVDANGMDTTALENLCQKEKVSLVYVTPHHHYPTTVTLSPDRRIHLLQLADRFDFAILEDDYDYDFHYANNPLLPLASGDQNGRVLYIGSLSKNLSPAIRIGYLVSTPEVIRELPKIRRLMDRQGDVIMERALAELFHEGIIRRYLKKALKQYRRRRDLCEQLLKESLSGCIQFEQPNGGLAIWAKFHPDIKLPVLSRIVAAKGLYLSDGNFYHPQENAIRMGFACMSEEEITQAVKILQETIHLTFPTFADT